MHYLYNISASSEIGAGVGGTNGLFISDITDTSPEFGLMVLGAI